MANKLYLFILSFWFSFSLISAQEGSNKSLYLLPSFEKGRAYYTAGGSSGALFNYNMTTNKILFMSDSIILELANLDEISYINIGDRTFEHITASKFYEKIAIDSLDLYVFWNAKFVYKGKKEAYGVVSQTSASTQLQSFDDVSRQSSSHNLETNAEYDIDLSNRYFLKIDGKYKQFNSITSLAKLFNTNSADIINKLESEKLNFRKFNDVKKAISLCSQYVF